MIENGNVDVVIGSRFIAKKKEHSLRMLGSDILSMIIKISTGKKIQNPTSGMRMFRNKVLYEFAYDMNYGPEPDTISYLIKQGMNVEEVQVTMDDRIAGESYLNLAKSIKYMVYMTYVLRKIRKSQMKIDGALYWIFLGVVLLLISIFPGICVTLANIIGVESPANLVF